MNAYDVVTDKIVSMLESGTVPWRKPWTCSAPRNVDGREYRGINAFILNAAPFENPTFVTLRRANELGAHIRKGEKSIPVVFWKVMDAATAAKTPQTPDETESGTFEISTRRARFLLRYYSVFNVAQVEGLPGSKVPALATFSHDPIPEAQSIVDAMPNPPGITVGGAGAWYSPAVDAVRVPDLARFPRREEYYNTLFHELGHSTGHKSRLCRKSVADAISLFGSADYSREELVAEMTAAFLCGRCGIAPATLENSAAYVAGWIRTLKADNKAAVIAAAQAQKAADYVLGASIAAVETAVETAVAS